MARPERNNVDYFPFLCKEGKTMYYIEEKYRNDGFATWIKILRQLAVTDYHYLNLSNKVDMMFLSSKCKVSEVVLESIINDLCDMGEFEETLWRESKIIFSVKFVNHIKDAYLKRNNECITLSGLLTLLDSLGVRKLSKSKSKVPVNAQSKEDYTKVDESKANQSIENESELGADKSASTEERAKIFMGKIAESIDIYPKDMLRAFYDYWTEMNEGGRKMRFEMEKVFDLKKRLKKWSDNNNKSINGKGTNAKQQHTDSLIEGIKERHRAMGSNGSGNDQ